MHTHLEQLLKLQVVDYDLGELERSKDYLPDMMENLNREIQEAKSRQVEAAEQLEGGKLTRGKLEGDLQVLEASLQKYQQQMMSIKTNKEYDALVSEIDNIKASISEAETKLLETIESIETLEGEVGSSGEKVATIEQNNIKQLSILQEKVDSIGEKVSSKKLSRQEIAAEIPKATMSTYERVRRGRGGRAVVTVKKKACGSCFKALTPKRMQDIKRADRVFTCDYCGCLLYWVEETS